MMHRVANTITQTNKSLHAKQRRLLSYGFSEPALKSYEAAIHEHVDIFCSLLSQDSDETSALPLHSSDGWSEPMNMATWCKLLRI